MKSKNAGARQVAIVAAAVVATAGLAGSVGAAPAAAAPSIARCQAHTTGPTFDPVRKTVTGAHFLFCDPDTVVDLPVGITRDGRAVAEGEGFAVYHCRGTDIGEFRVNASPPRSLPCG